MNPGEWSQFAKDVGLLGAACWFFIWISWKREISLSARITDLETFVQTTLLVALGKNTEALVTIDGSMKHISNTLDELTRATAALEATTLTLARDIEFRPCLLPNDHPAKIAAANKMKELLKNEATHD